MVTIACIVEGHGEVQALPVLLRRIAAEIDPGTNLRVPSPFRAHRSRLLIPEVFAGLRRFGVMSGSSETDSEGGERPVWVAAVVA